MSKHATVLMEVSKLTKGAVQYKENLDGAQYPTDSNYLIGTLYLRKTGLVHNSLADQLTGDRVEYPARIRVTVEVVE